MKSREGGFIAQHGHRERQGKHCSPSPGYRHEFRFSLKERVGQGREVYAEYGLVDHVSVLVLWGNQEKLSLSSLEGSHLVPRR